jgi:hemerythrin-like domain-containing protein
MDETLQLIDQLIAEHKTIGEKNRSLEKAANDVRLLSGLKQAGDTFVRGEISQNEDLKNLAQIINIITAWLEKHFNREETALLPAVKKYGDENLVASLDSLLFEHSDLRDRMLHSRKRVDELLGSSLDQVRRDASVRDLRVHLNHSRKLLETHAARENHFFTELRRHLKKATKRKE